MINSLVLLFSALWIFIGLYVAIKYDDKSLDDPYFHIMFGLIVAFGWPVWLVYYKVMKE